MKPLRKLALLAAALLPCVPLHGTPKEMIVLSSASYHAGDDAATAVAADGEGNILVTGVSDSRYRSVKYNKNLLPIQTGEYYSGLSGDTPHGLAVDAFGDIFVAGEVSNGANQDYFTVKYGPNFQSVLSSAAYRGGYDDKANALALDSQGNVFVAGYSNDGASESFLTIKYGRDLDVRASKAYDSGGPDQAAAVAVDGQDNVIVAGATDGGAGWNYLVIKYDNDLNVLGTAVFDSGRDEKATGVAVDGQGGIVVTGRQYDGATWNYCTLRYDADLNFVSSTTYDSGRNDIASGVAVDSRGNVVVTGYRGIAPANDYFTVKYDAGFVVLSSASYDGGSNDMAAAVAVDPQDNVIVTGKSYNGLNNDYFTIKYNGSPSVGSATAFQGESVAVKMTGKSFLEGTAVSFSDPGISAGAASVIPQNQLTVTVSVSSSVAVGVTTVTVTSPNGEYVTGPLVEIARRRAVDPARDETVSALAPAGGMSVAVPAGSFLQVSTITVGPATDVPSSPGLSRQAGRAVTVSVLPQAAPGRDVTITLPYRDEDIAGLDENKLALGYYDDANSRWVYLYSATDKAGNTVTGTTRLLNRRFAVVEFTETPSGGGAAAADHVLVYPNPYKPGSGGEFDDTAYGEGVVFAGLPAEFKLKVLNIAGELVFSGETVSDVFGKYLWDTKNEQGEKIASGVYLYLVQDARDASKKAKGKFSVIR